MEIVPGLVDDGGRRLGSDRRQFSYTLHIPERRTLPDRRFVPVRRNGLDRRGGVERRVKAAIPALVELRSGKDRRSGIERRAPFARGVMAAPA